MRRLVAIAIALILVCGSASAQGVRFPSVAVGNSPAGPEITGWMYRPAGAGPFPAIILAHSCAGVSPHTETWGKRLASWGYVVLAPDSFGPRGEKSVCTRGVVVSGNMRVADVAGALRFLATQPDVRADRIGLIGHSHGGWTVMRSVQKSYGLAAMGLRAAVAYYPSCAPQFDRDVDIPLLVLIGDKDDWTPADRCRQLQAAGFVRPDLVDVVYYPNAYHSFDSNARDRTVPGGGGKVHRLAYDPEAAADAEARTRAFFASLLR
ncbi:dienelactone hydrolase family protein [Reyranella sp.]|uniref:dienelactone hydrolase family protein n=1 Tax=Reyranella sp. TaxID=1929291 RepID=UPI003BAD35C7